MLRSLLLACVVLTGACKKDAAVKPKPDVKGVVGTDGIRRVAIEAGMDGYVPGTIPGKPGEKLVLVFTRTAEGECLSELKTPDGKLVPLPMNKAVEINVTVPITGEVAFACGMDMFKGVVVADPKS